MLYPNRIKERLLSLQGYRAIAGVDEAGRGSWAGPLVAGAVILEQKKRIPGVKDSKKLRAPIRRLVYEKIITRARVWSVGIVSATEIDQIGIGAANCLAMMRALENLTLQPDYILIDAMRLDDCAVPHQAIVKGDHKITSIAAASIIAKVTRDRLMENLDEQYPQYGFKQHKGYGTNHHFSMLMTHGVSPAHRMSFRPMKDLGKA